MSPRATYMYSECILSHPVALRTVACLLRQWRELCAATWRISFTYEIIRCGGSRNFLVSGLEEAESMCILSTYM